MTKKPDHRAQALRFLATQGVAGGTWKELSAALGVHHGSASSVLSTLHKDGRAACLEDRRDRCRIYVLPDLVDGRPVRPQGRANGPAVRDLIDQSWQEGYDAAKAEEVPPPDLDLVRQNAYRDGVDRGHHDEAAALLRLVTEMRLNIRRQNRVLPHSRTCWLEHPDCALASVEKALYKTLPPPRRAPAA